MVSKALAGENSRETAQVISLSRPQGGGLRAQFMVAYLRRLNPPCGRRKAVVTKDSECIPFFFFGGVFSVFRTGGGLPREKGRGTFKIRRVKNWSVPAPPRGT